MRLALILLITPFFCHSHYQAPKDLKKLVYSQEPRIEIIIGNAYSVDKTFSIEVNGFFYKKIALSSKQQRRVVVKLPKVLPNTVSNFRICSVSRIENVRSKVCTKVKVYFLQR